MRNNVTRIDDGDYFAEFSEFRVMDDQERFARTRPKPGMQFTYNKIIWLALTFLAGAAVYGFGYMVAKEVIQRIR